MRQVLIPGSAVGAMIPFMLAVAANGAPPSSTAFTYQGQLKQDGVPVNDACDFAFSLWDGDNDPDPGTQVGSTIPLTIAVGQGLFQTQLDFGASAFNSETRWLQVDVCCSSPCGPAFSSLAPRHAITPAPRSLSTRGLHVDDTENVGIHETAPLARLHVQGAEKLLSDTALASDDVIVEDSDAVLGLYSGPGGSLGSVINLSEVDAGGQLTDKWSLFRETSASGSTLGLSYGGDPFYPNNPTLFQFGANGAFGIGTTTPEMSLDVKAEGAVLRLDSTDNIFGAGVILRSSRPSPGILGFVSFVDETASSTASSSVIGLGSGELLFTAGSQGSMTLDGAGRLGIGTDEPSDVLHVVHDQSTNGFGGILVENINPTAGQTTVYLDLRNNAVGAENTYRIQHVGNVAGREGNLEIWDVGGGAGRLAINPAGEVGIGTTQPASQLHVSRDEPVEETGGVVSGGVVTVGRLDRAQTLMDGQVIQVRHPDNSPGTMFLNPYGGPMNMGSGDFSTGGNLIVHQGNIGVGESNPVSRLAVTSTGGDTAITAQALGGAQALRVLGDAEFTGEIKIWPTIHYLMLNRADFRPYQNGLLAPVNLPDGVEITHLAVYYIGTIQGWATIELFVDPDTCEICMATELATLSPTGNAAQRVSAAGLSVFINNFHQAYYVRLISGFDPGGAFNPTITSVRIAYRISELT